MKYLTDSFDFTEGVQIENRIVKEWHSEVLKKLTEEGCTYSSIKSGNSIVFGRKHEDGEVTIYEVVSGFKEYTYEPNIGQSAQVSDTTGGDSNSKSQ